MISPYPNALFIQTMISSSPLNITPSVFWISSLKSLENDKE